MASVLNGLEAKQLITRQPSPVHAKVLIAALTEPGQEVLDRAYQEVNVLERAFAGTFSLGERATLRDLLERATAVLTEQTPHPGH